MDRIVVKFGGSNLKTKEDISKILKAVNNYKTPPVIVLSALYGITDTLVKTLKQIKTHGNQAEKLSRSLIEAHHRIIDLHIEDTAYTNKVKQQIEKRVEELSRYLLGVHYLGDTPDFAEDIVLSYGERLSSLVLTSILKYKKYDCEEKLPEEIGLISNGEYGNAIVDFPSSEKNVKKALSKLKIYVIPGFYGISKKNRVTIFGRGGSDYSAAAIGRCIGAEFVDIWKDVQGFMSADPKAVTNPVGIEKLTYREAAELSYFGAQILHPRTFAPLIDKNIPIRMFNIDQVSNRLKPLTIIGHKKVMKRDVIKSVTFSDDFGVLKLHGPGVGIRPGIMAKVTTRLSDSGINIKSIITSQTSINILLALKNLKKSYEIAKKLDIATVGKIDLFSGISLIAVVGEGMIKKPGIAARVFTAVSKHNINLKMISAGASEVAIYFIIDQKDRKKAIKAIHGEFFKGL